MEEKLLFKEECFMIVGLCMKIHRKLGKGFKESVYKDALEIELQNAIIPYEREKKFKIEYENVILRHTFDADFLVYKSIIVEIKAASMVHADAFRQTVNYLRSEQIKLGILINFGTDVLQFQRIICSSYISGNLKK
ncbi:MAG: GxxExxY protein [Chitinophagaceae bacterium]|nr:GxxExxY protein [Chitinophagaceae bacterium]